jgi:hypothetical protein
MPLPAFLAPSVPKTTPSNWKPKAALRAAERAAKAALRQGLSPAAAWQQQQLQQERYPWLPASPPVLEPLRLVAAPLDPEGFSAPPAVVAHDEWPWAQHAQRMGSVLPGEEALLLTPLKRPGAGAGARLGPFTPPGPGKRHKAVAGPRSDDPNAPKSGTGRMRVQEFPKVRRGERCGWCHTCTNPQLKKACLTRRQEMEQEAAAGTQA